MSLVKWNPEASLSSWMDDFFTNNDVWFKPLAKGTNIPAVNVKEAKDAFKLEVAAPGFKKDDFKLEVENGYMTISGESKTEKEDKDDKVTRSEFSYSSFTRSFSLPKNVRAEEIVAKYDDGILRITVPKAKEVEKPAKTIAIG